MRRSVLTLAVLSALAPAPAAQARSAHAGSAGPAGGALRLTPAQVATVEAGVRASAGDAGAQFGAIAGTRIDATEIMVCGRVRLAGNPGGAPLEALFLGNLLPGQGFVPDEIARGGGSLTAATSACHAKGLNV